MKQVEHSKKVKDLVAKALESDAVDFEKIAVFEAIAINTLPLTKAGVYNGAVLTKSTIKEMEAFLNKENFVPLHINHQQAGQLPVGRTFFGKTTDRLGKGGKEITDLSVLFFISNGTSLGTTLIDGLDHGVINEVSVGIYPKQVKCSKCEFDYIKDGSWLNWIDATCANDHKIGDKGVHAILDGLDRFMELSLVSLGAANKARVKSGDNSIIASLEEEDCLQRLAASSAKESLSLLVATKGTELKMIKLNATELTALREDFKTRGKKALDAKHEGITELLAKIGDDMTVDDAAALRAEFATALATFSADPDPKPDDKPVEPIAAITLTLDSLIEAKTAQKMAEVSAANLTTVNTDLQAQLTTAKAEIATLTTKQATFEALTADNAAMKDFLKLSCQSLIIASGVSNGTVPESVADLVATIKTAQGKLSKLPVGGLGFTPEALSASNDSKSNTSSTAFKTKK